MNGLCWPREDARLTLRGMLPEQAVQVEVEVEVEVEGKGK